MGKIISLDDKIAVTREREAEIIRRRKIMAVRQVFQCSSCAFKCEKCGTQIAQDEDADFRQSRKLRVPYNFCDACAQEYVDYIDRLKGEGDEDCYWHNEAWLDAWKKWIDYQGSVDRYLKSKEFLQLLRELKHTGPEK